MNGHEDQATRGHAHGATEEARQETSALPAAEKLAAETTEALIQMDLVSPDKAEALRRGLAAGSISAEEWRALIEFRREVNGGPNEPTD